MKMRKVQTMIAAGLPRFRRPDHHAIASVVRPGESVLDVGCGDGRLMALLRAERGSPTRGLEISGDGVSHCLARGLAVVQGDAEKDLAVYPDDAFDCAVLSRAIQAMNRPERVLAELVRIAPRILVSIDNYGHWLCRLDFLIHGRASSLGSSPTGIVTRLCSARDLADLAAAQGLVITGAVPIGRKPRQSVNLTALNLLSKQIVFVLERAPPTS